MTINLLSLFNALVVEKRWCIFSYALYNREAYLQIGVKYMCANSIQYYVH